MSPDAQPRSIRTWALWAAPVALVLAPLMAVFGWSAVSESASATSRPVPALYAYSDAPASAPGLHQRQTLAPPLHADDLSDGERRGGTALASEGRLIVAGTYVYDDSLRVFGRESAKPGSARVAVADPRGPPTAVPTDSRSFSRIVVAPNPGLMHGSGPGPGVLEVSANVKSTGAVRNFNPNYGHEFVFDPTQERFVVGASQKGFGHYGLAQEIGADESTVVGGIFSRGPAGEFFTDEMSGHYGVNWTNPVRAQFVDFMQRYGFDVTHTRWPGGS